VKRGSLAGLGALAFPVLTFVGMIIMSPPGGNYKASDVADYVKSGHRPLVFLGAYMGAIGVVGLVFLLARLRAAIADSTRASIFWALGIASAAGLAAGFALAAAVPIAMGYGGKGVTLSPTVTYTFAEAGWVLIAGVGGVLLGCALLLFALGGAAVPSWVRWSTLVAGVAAIAGYAWFPFALVLIWSLALGIWLLAGVARHEPAAAPSAA
jgi:hypothetical protein